MEKEEKLNRLKTIVFALRYTKAHLEAHYRELTQKPSENTARFFATVDELLKELTPIVGDG